MKRQTKQRLESKRKSLPSCDTSPMKQKKLENVELGEHVVSPRRDQRSCFPFKPSPLICSGEQSCKPVWNHGDARSGQKPKKCLSSLFSPQIHVNVRAHISIALCVYRRKPQNCMFGTATAAGKNIDIRVITVYNIYVKCSEGWFT